MSIFLSVRSVKIGGIRVLIHDPATNELDFGNTERPIFNYSRIVALMSTVRTRHGVDGRTKVGLDHSLRPRILGLYSLIIVLMGCLAGCAASTQPALQLAPQVDLNRYAGRWYVIAHIPYWAERGVVGSYDEYGLRPDGTLSNVFNGHDKTLDAPLDRTMGHADVVPGTGNAKWRVSFIWPIYVSYLILYVDPDYRYALIGYPDRSLGWVLSRDKTIDEATYRQLLQRFAAEGYDTAQFRRVPQIEAQIGAPGFAE